MSQVEADAEYDAWIAEVDALLRERKPPANAAQLEPGRCRAAFHSGWRPEQFAGQKELPFVVIKGPEERAREMPDMKAFFLCTIIAFFLFAIFNWLIPKVLQNKVDAGLKVGDLDPFTTTLAHMSAWFHEHMFVVTLPVALILVAWFIGLWRSR